MHATAPNSDTFVPHRFPARSASSCSWRAVSPATEATKNTKLCLSATGHQAAALLKAASCSQQQRLPASIAPKTAPPSSPVATVKQQPPQLEGAPNRSPDHRGNKPSPLPTSEHAKSQTLCRTFNRNRDTPAQKTRIPIPNPQQKKQAVASTQHAAVFY